MDNIDMVTYYQEKMSYNKNWQGPEPTLKETNNADEKDGS
jgi:hypothetical protein